MAPTRAKKSLGPRVVLVLRTLCHLNKNQRRALLKTADKNIVRGICECALNILHGVVSLSKQQKSKLKKYKNVLRKLVDVRKKSRKSWKKTFDCAERGRFFTVHTGTVNLDFIV